MSKRIIKGYNPNHGDKRSASFQGVLEYAKEIIQGTVTGDSQPEWPSGEAPDSAFDNLPPMPPSQPFPTTIHTTPEGLAYLLEKHGEGKKDQ